jgi:uncharacterized protein YjdB
LSYDTGSCVTATETFSVTINPIPNIAGLNKVCVGLSIPLSADVGGGTWNSSNIATATVGASTGVVTGVAAGIVTISYTTPAGCIGTKIITVNPLPAIITGTLSVCVNSTTILSDSTIGGTWTIIGTGTAIVGASTGVVTGVAGGTVIVSYTLPTGCYKTAIVTVNSLPVITGTMNVCEGATTSLGTTIPGGTWSSADITIATVSSTGIVTGIVASAVIITYISPAGCIDTCLVNVYALPVITPLGPLTVCVGSYTGIFGSPTGALGTWSASNGHATIGYYLNGISVGIDTISYTYGYAPGASCTAIKIVTVNPTPVITDTGRLVCVGATIAYGTGISGGIWTSSNTSVATVGSSTGIVTGISYGTAIITYTLPTGCFDTALVHVTKKPSPISGYSPLCLGVTVGFTDTIMGGGRWTSSNTAVAIVGLVAVAQLLPLRIPAVTSFIH